MEVEGMVGLVLGLGSGDMRGVGSVDEMEWDEIQEVSRPKTHFKGVTVISHLKPEGLKYNLTQTVIL